MRVECVILILASHCLVIELVALQSNENVVVERMISHTGTGRHGPDSFGRQQ